MTKYFYTNSLDAFYMEQKWGVKYKFDMLGLEGIKASLTTTSCVIRLGDKPPAVNAFVIEPDEPDEKWVVHEDSVHLFEPQVGDLVCHPSGRLGYVQSYKGGQVTIDVNGGDWDCKKEHLVGGIIQRNNTAFIYPEVEHD